MSIATMLEITTDSDCGKFIRLNAPDNFEVAFAVREHDFVHVAQLPSGAVHIIGNRKQPVIKDRVCGLLLLREVRWSTGSTWFRSINTSRHDRRHWRATSEQHAQQLLLPPQMKEQHHGKVTRTASTLPAA